MSRRAKPVVGSLDRKHAAIFAALGDQTRLQLLGKLAVGDACSIAELTGGVKLTRQAVTKHLRVLEQAGLVQRSRIGRETQFVLSPQPIKIVQGFLASVSAQWDAALGRLKAHVEAGDLQR